MIRSMTGYGKAEVALSCARLYVEARSVNSKQLDISLRLPPPFKDKEQNLRIAIAPMLKRGKADIDCRIEWHNGKLRQNINTELAAAYLLEIKHLEKQLHISSPDPMALLLKMPEVLTSQTTGLHEQDWEITKEKILEAIRNLDRFRKEEGKKLQKDIELHIAEIEQWADAIKKLGPKRISDMRNRLEIKLEEWKDRINQDRFEQELIYYMEKLDFNEELVRLSSHCAYFQDVMKQEEAQGKKLVFISQEIGREINTIGSKANDAGIQKLVVQMKDALEKIKEQLLNVL